MEKRLFFAYRIYAPWPLKLPHGRVVQEKMRHMTLVFLGQADSKRLLSLLPFFPKPSFKIGKAGYFDSCLFLPERHPNVISWHANWMEDCAPLVQYHISVADWLKENKFSFDARFPWLAHVTLARKPFDKNQWKDGFKETPFYFNEIHLYESLPGLQYLPLWTLSLTPPFKEIEHTADVGFTIFGENPNQVFWNAFSALCHHFPELLKFRPEEVCLSNIDEIIMALNACISKADAAAGCPFKAISFHGNLEEKNSILQWEMIVDV